MCQGLEELRAGLVLIYPQMLKLIRWWFCVHRRRSSKANNPGQLEQVGVGVQQAGVVQMCVQFLRNS